jgi:hypothetical protein
MITAIYCAIVYGTKGRRTPQHNHQAHVATMSLWCHAEIATVATTADNSMPIRRSMWRWPPGRKLATSIGG